MSRPCIVASVAVKSALGFGAVTPAAVVAAIGCCCCCCTKTRYLVKDYSGCFLVAVACCSVDNVGCCCCSLKACFFCSWNGGRGILGFPAIGGSRGGCSSSFSLSSAAADIIIGADILFRLYLVIVLYSLFIRFLCVRGGTIVVVVVVTSLLLSIYL